MRYTVIADPSADDALMNFWLNAPDPAALTAAADRIETALKDDPESKGVYCEGLFIHRDFPLVVVYEIVPDDRLVRVLSFGVIHK